MKLKDLITEVSRDDYGAKSVENTKIEILPQFEDFVDKPIFKLMVMVDDGKLDSKTASIIKKEMQKIEKEASIFIKKVKSNKVWKLIENLEE